jgi:hypothetical protein
MKQSLFILKILQCTHAYCTRKMLTFINVRGGGTMDTAEWKMLHYMFIFFILVSKNVLSHFDLFANLLNIFQYRVNGA